LEMILHDQRIATHGDVRRSATPSQWDPIPEFHGRKRGRESNELIASLAYREQKLEYSIGARSRRLCEWMTRSGLERLPGTDPLGARLDYFRIAGKIHQMPCPELV
jgi:hypothetical protein